MTTRVVVVGTGSMGERHARVFAATPGAVLAGVYDLDPARAQAVAARWGASAFLSLDAAIERADLVVLATPTALHEAQARRAILRRRHVLVEKPMCSTGARARELCELAADAGVHLLVGHSERFNPVVRALVAATADDPALRIETRRHGTARPSREEICLNLAVHDVDLAAVLFRDDVELAHASGRSDRAELFVRTGAGQEARVEVSHGSRRARTVRVQTTRFVYEGDLLACSLTRADADGRGASMDLDDAEPLALQAAAAIAALANRPSAIATGDDGARAVRVAERALAEQERVSAAE